MNDLRQDSVLRAIDRTIDLFTQMRTPDAVSAAAYDTLKQARALVVRALEAEPSRPARPATALPRAA